MVPFQRVTMNESTGDRPGHNPHNDPAFWQDLQETFENALDLLHQLADAQGIKVPSDEVIREEERQIDERAYDHPLPRSAAEYAERVNRWFRRAKSLIYGWSGEAARAAELDAVTEDLEREVVELQEAVQEIADHRYQIHVKLLRAVRERIRANSPLLVAARDAGESSARDALNGIERSIAMWMRMREVFPEEEDGILNLLVHLENLRDGAVREFPEAVLPRNGEVGVSQVDPGERLS